MIKIMPFNANSAREISFNKILKNCPVVLKFRKQLLLSKNGELTKAEVKNCEKVGLVFPLTEELPEEIDLEEIWERLLIILSSLEKINIAHLDFRPENLCLHRGSILLRDFGNSYLLDSSTGYLPRERYPEIQIGGPEFYFDFNTLPSDEVLSRRNETLAGNFKGRYPLALKKVLPGSEFDCRADLWSAAAWVYQLLEGEWPVNDPLDYKTLATASLERKYGIVGVHISRILTSLDFRTRPWASQLAQDFEVSIISLNFGLAMPEPELNHAELKNFELTSLWKKGIEKKYRGEEITANYLWILLVSQRWLASDDCQKLLFLFLKNKSWTSEEIEIFLSLDSNIFTSNLLSLYDMETVRERYFDFLGRPKNYGALNENEITTQRNLFLSIISSKSL